MQNKKAALKICSVYFLSMFATSVFVNLAFIQPNNIATYKSETLALYLEKIEALELEYNASQIQIVSEDLTGIKDVVEKKRNRRKEREARELARQERKARTHLALQSTLVRAQHIAEADVMNENDPHPNAGFYSQSFVPFDKNIEKIPVKYTAANDNFSENDIRNTIVSKAKKHLGTRYRWAGKAPGGFDCSGFTAYMMNQFGIAISSSSRHQGMQGEMVKVKETKPGDLVFFSRYGKGGRITHVAMVVENEGDRLHVIHACSRGIVIDDVLNDKYWKNKILHARNVINPASKETADATKS